MLITHFKTTRKIFQKRKSIMKIFNKIFTLSLLFTTVAIVMSCSDEHAEYTPASTPSGSQVYFPSTASTNFVLSLDNSEFEIPICRVKTDGELNVTLKASGSEYISVPSSVKFVDGDSTANIKITYNPEAIGYDNPQTVNISLVDSTLTTPYGCSVFALKAVIPSPWRSLGKGKFADAFLGDADLYSDVEILQNELEPNTFRIVEPYAEILNGITTDKYLEFFILPAGSEFKDFVTDAEYVIFNDYNTGQWNSNYAEDIYAIHPYRMGRTPDRWNYNVVLDYQENGLPGEVSLAPVYYLFNEGGGWDQANANTISILFPGYVKADYSAEVQYTGIFTAADETVSAVANLTLGADATDVKAIVMTQADDAAAVADALAAGELEGTPVQAGRIEVPFNAEELGSENLQVIVAVIVDGAVKNVASSGFEYYGGGSNPWQSIGIGYYTDDVLVPMFYEDGTPVTYEVEILEHAEHPGLYRIMNPYAKSVHPYGDDDYAPEGMYIEVNATDAEGVYIQQQSLGMDWGYGEMQLVSNGARYLAANAFEDVKAAGYLGKVSEGVIVFPTFTQSNGTTYQGILFMGESGYLAGMNGKMEITLPSSNAFAKNIAKAKANITKRNSLKKSFFGVKADKRMVVRLNSKATKID